MPIFEMNSLIPKVKMSPPGLIIFCIFIIKYPIIYLIFFSLKYSFFNVNVQVMVYLIAEMKELKIYKK